MRTELGDRYVDAIRASFELPENCDFVMYWWHMAAEITKKRDARRFGLITTSQITGSFNASVVSDHLYAEDPVSIDFAVPDHPWVDNKDGASVRIALTCLSAGNHDGILETLTHVRGERHMSDSEEFEARSGYILPNLAIGPNVRGSCVLQSNGGMAAVGFQFNGRGFAVDAEQAASYLSKCPKISSNLRPFVNGNDITQKPRRLWMLDFYGLTEADLASDYPDAYQHLLLNVKPERSVNPRESRRRNWWIFGEALSPFRPAMKGLQRILATPITSKHRLWVRRSRRRSKWKG